MEDTVDEYNLKATKNGYRTYSVEEIQQLLDSRKAIMCNFCGILILRGNSSLQNNLSRHQLDNIKCLRSQLQLYGVDSREREVVAKILAQSPEEGVVS